MLIAAVGPGEFTSIPSLWDGSVDNQENFVLALDVQAGDFIEVHFTFAGAGSFQWTCTPDSSDVTTLGGSTGYFCGIPRTPLYVTDHRMWMGLFISTTTQTLRFKIAHQLVLWGNVSQDYRISNATLSAIVVGKNYD